MYEDKMIDRIINAISMGVVVLALILSALLMVIMVGAFASESFANFMADIILGS